jgi:ketosteroid isomerase-like protein
MATAVNQSEFLSDRFAIVDLINDYLDATDAKRWDLLGQFYTEDAVVWMNPQTSITGRATIVNYTSQMLGTDDIVTYHHVASFTPKIDGDTAEAAVRIRAMHNGVGSRAGRFWESLAVQNTHFVRTPDGWRCRGYEWKVVVGLGSLDLFDGLRPKT